MESWPIRSRGFMGRRAAWRSWGLGELLSSAAYGRLYTSIGWRGLLMIGVLPAKTIVYVRSFVKEPPVWAENRRLQRVQQPRGPCPLDSIIQRGIPTIPKASTGRWPEAIFVDYSIFASFDLPAIRIAELAGNRGVAEDAAEPRVLFVGVAVGLGGRPARPAHSDHHPGPAHDPDHAALSVHWRLRDDRGVFHDTGRFDGDGMHVHYPAYRDMFPTEEPLSVVAGC